MDELLTPLLTVAVIGVVFTALELLRPARPAPAPRWRRYVTDLLHLTLGGFMIRASITLAVGWLLAHYRVGGAAQGLPLWIQFPLVLLLCDLMTWFAHRTYHAVPALWEFHKIHHSSEHLDWLASYRVHPLEQIVTSLAVIVPVMLLGFSPAAVLVYLALYQWHTALLHSNVAVSLGPLERIVATNRFHHWHHADHVEAYDRNFGAQLVIWDRLFGTAHRPAQPRPDRFGVDGAPRENFLSHLVAPFVRSIAR